MGSTDVTVVTGDRFEVQGTVKEVEERIISAARGSILELARLKDASTGEDVAINPAHVVALRAAQPRAAD